MVEVECRSARPGGVTLVAVRIDNRVESPGVEAHRVRLVSQLDGPVWPPRVEGVPAGAWNCADAAGSSDASDGGVSAASAGDASVDVVVPTGRVGSVGFASPAEPVDPPVAVDAVEPAGECDELDPRPEDVLRVLGDPSPPRDAVAVPEPGESSARRQRGRRRQSGEEP